jgi:hypothetical protein|tara:strand:+ start:348 stop:842 length:495 start_codon:yes stop_codon:yes gene_type:complete
MNIYIYKIYTSYHDDKNKVKNFIDNHEGGDWYFIQQKENFSLYKLPTGELSKYSDEIFEYSYDKDEEGYGTTLIQVKQDKIVNYEIDFDSNYLSNTDIFQLQLIHPWEDGDGNSFYCMDVYSEDGYEEGFYGSAFQDHSWTNKDGGLDEYFDGEVTVDDLISKI